MKTSGRVLGVALTIGCAFIGVRSVTASITGCNTIEALGNEQCLQSWSECRQANQANCNQDKQVCLADVQELYKECLKGTPPRPGSTGAAYNRSHDVARRRSLLLNLSAPRIVPDSRLK